MKKKESLNCIPCTLILKVYWVIFTLFICWELNYFIFSIVYIWLQKFSDAICKVPSCLDCTTVKPYYLTDTDEIKVQLWKANGRKWVYIRGSHKQVSTMQQKHGRFS